MIHRVCCQRVHAQSHMINDAKLIQNRSIVNGTLGQGLGTRVALRLVLGSKVQFNVCGERGPYFFPNIFALYRMRTLMFSFYVYMKYKTLEKIRGYYTCSICTGAI